MKNIFKGEAILFFIIPLILSCIGILFIFSTGQLENGTNSNLYLKQILWVFIGLGIFCAIILIDYYYIIETSILYYFMGIGLLTFTLLFGKATKGAKSWLGVAGLGIQISELMKLCYILFYAKVLSNISKEDSKEDKEIFVFVKSLCILAPPLLLVLLQPDMGTAIVFCNIFLVMSLIGFKKIDILLTAIMVGLCTVFLTLGYTYYNFYHVLIIKTKIPLFEIFFNTNTLFSIAIILLSYATIAFVIELFNPVPWINKFTRSALVLGLGFSMTALTGKILKPYQWDRLLVFINPEVDKLRSGYNIIQSQIAIGAGEIMGKGLFKGSQNKLGFLPEKHTDFIFAILAEETGFLGAFSLIFIYGFYLILMYRTIIFSKDHEGTYIATGILAMYATHILINIGMNIGMAPVTGIPLPFLSYGGSFYISTIISSALLLNIYHRRFLH